MTKRFSALPICVMSSLILVCGCDNSGLTDRENTLPSDGPWVTIDEDAFGLSGLTGGTEERPEFTCKNAELLLLLEAISNEFGVTIEVNPGDLVDRGVNLVIEGADAKEILNQIATATSLTLTIVGEKQFRLSKDEIQGNPGYTVSPAY